jgi:hypothetical protein
MAKAKQGKGEKKKQDKQSWRITRVQRIEAARQKIRNGADWTIDDFRKYLEEATAETNQWDKSKFLNPPVLTNQRCKTVMTKVASDMKLSAKQTTKWKFKAKKPAAEIEAERIKAENMALKEEYLATLKK